MTKADTLIFSKVTRNLAEAVHLLLEANAPASSRKSAATAAEAFADLLRLHAQRRVDMDRGRMDASK